jgi:hypothetical protein
MRELPIADCRLPIWGLRARSGLARSCHDGGQIGCFLQDFHESLFRQNFRFTKQFQSQRSFIGFFFNNSNFRNEFSPASRATRRAVVCSNGCSAADNLPCNHTTGSCFWNHVRQFDNSQCKSLRSGFEFRWVHRLKLQIQSAIGNRQSAIKK